MASLSREMVTHILKFVVTGLLAFYASTIYTDIKTAPNRNVSIIPLFNSLDTLCKVDQEKLMRKQADLQNILKRPASVHPNLQIDSIEKLNALLAFKNRVDGLTQASLSQALVPIGGPDDNPDQLKQLKNDGILICDADKKSENTVLKVMAVIIFDNPNTPYAFGGECSIVQDKDTIPLKIEEEVNGEGWVKSEAQHKNEYKVHKPLILSETKVLVLTYDPRLKMDINVKEEVFKNLVGNIESKQAYEYSLVCEVIQKNGKKIRMGENQLFEFKNNALDIMPK